MKQFLLCSLLFGIVYGQFPPGPPGPPGKWPGGNRPSGYPKQPMGPQRGSPFSSLASVLPGGSANRESQAPPSYDDPIPQIPSDPSYDSQSLPSRLPILAPNGVYEIYNRVVDDLIARLEVDFSKKKMDPMEVVIRATPPGPVRVPGHLQRRPFRRPGAPLYRAGAVSAPPPPPFGGPGGPPPPSMKKIKKGRSDPAAESRFPEGKRPAVGVEQVKEEPEAGVRANAKVSKAPAAEVKDETVVETTPAGVVVEEVAKANETSSVEEADDSPSSEEAVIMVGKSRSEEMAEDDLDDENDDHVTVKLRKKTKKDDTQEEDEDEPAAAAAATGAKTSLTKVDTLVEKYANKNTAGTKYTAANTKTKPIKQAIVDKNVSEDDDDDDDDNDQERDDVSDDDDLHFDAEPGTGGPGRPNGGYYPQGGPPAVPAKPNAVLTGLSKMRRTSDVSVVLDARSAMITARLLVGPITVQINDSLEPKERGIKATIPELEAEMIMMERHGVVFLQRFTLDRAYGQDVEISIPKGKSGSSSSSNKKKNSSKQGNQGRPGQPGFDNSGNPASQDRYQTKMAAHISMEVVKLLRSGNLRVNLMRTAQGSMTKLKLPIQKKAKKTKKEKKQEALKNKSKESS